MCNKMASTSFVGNDLSNWSSKQAEQETGLVDLGGEPLVTDL